MAETGREVSRAFDPYEVIGVITPGAVVALLLAFEWPEFRSLIGGKGLSLGDFGLFVVVSFVLGHLIQAGGNLLEPVVWLGGGLPTNWVRAEKQTLITRDQRVTLQTKVSAMEGQEIDIAKVDRRSWRAITTRAYGRLKAAGLSARVDNSNRTYGLFRGLAAALVASLVWFVAARRDDHSALALTAIALIAAVYRMRRIGQHYARGLILDFIDLDSTRSEEPAGGR